MRNPTPRSLALVAAIFALSVGAQLAPDRAVAEEATKELLDLSARRLAGSEEPLSRYRGEVLLIVNTASECGYTPQYAGLQTLYERYRENKFNVLGFPSNDFGEQEPGDDRQIGAFCKSNYGVEFPMFSKVRVLGADAHPVYAYLTSLPKPIGGPVEWNFQKYLVDRNGNVVARFESETEPDDPALVAAVELLCSPSRPLRRSPSRTPRHSRGSRGELAAAVDPTPRERPAPSMGRSFRSSRIALTRGRSAGAREGARRSPGPARGSPPRIGQSLERRIYRVFEFCEGFRETEFVVGRGYEPRPAEVGFA